MRGTVLLIFLYPRLGRGFLLGRRNAFDALNAIKRNNSYHFYCSYYSQATNAKAKINSSLIKVKLINLFMFPPVLFLIMNRTNHIQTCFSCWQVPLTRNSLINEKCNSKLEL